MQPRVETMKWAHVDVTGRFGCRDGVDRCGWSGAPNDYAQKRCESDKSLWTTYIVLVWFHLPSIWILVLLTVFAFTLFNNMLLDGVSCDMKSFIPLKNAFISYCVVSLGRFVPSTHFWDTLSSYWHWVKRDCTFLNSSWDWVTLLLESMIITPFSSSMDYFTRVSIMDFASVRLD